VEGGANAQAAGIGDDPSDPRAAARDVVDTAPEGDEWFHEQKFDGYRIIAERAGCEVQLFTRRFNDWTCRNGSSTKVAIGQFGW
jgi:ATP-dependent DNA ligase